MTLSIAYNVKILTVSLLLQIPWELRPFRAAQYYDAELGEFEKPAPPQYIE